MANKKQKRAMNRYKQAKKFPLGSGKRFNALKEVLEAKGYNEDSAKRIVASIGRKKYGNAKMNKWAKQGRKRRK